MWIGRAIEVGERVGNRPGAAFAARFAAGAILVAVLCAGAATAGLALEAVLFDGWVGPLPVGFALACVVASAGVAYRGLYEHVAAVRDALLCDLSQGRAAVARIVGRDPDALDQSGVCRAAIESAAENFSDAFVAPLFWLCVLGLPGLALYKTVNTCDSMIGHRSERYEAFGKVAARLDDVMNWVPARLAAILIVGGAGLTAGADPRASLRAVRSDARAHASPNAGWPEAAMAGALDVALGGPKSYGGALAPVHWLHARGRRELHPGDIGRALALYAAAGALAGLAVLTALAGICALRA